MERPLKIIFRVDADPQTGLGHVKRCEALGSQLRMRAAEILFVGEFDQTLKAQLRSAGIASRPITQLTNSEEEFDAFLDACREFAADIVIIDNYAIDRRYCRRLMDCGYFTVTMNDTGMTPLPCHILVNTNFNAENLDLKVENGTTLMLGSSYLLLPQEYGDRSDQSSGIDPVSDVLITMGGFDPNRLTERTLRALDGIRGEFKVTVVIGPHFDNEESITKQAEQSKRRVIIVKSPASLHPSIKNCSIAVCSAGQTVYQVASVGRPSVSISQAVNQEEHLKEMSSAGAVTGLRFEDSEAFDVQLKESITDLIDDPAKRVKMADTARRMIDGRGARRTAEGIIKAYQNKALSVRH